MGLEKINYKCINFINKIEKDNNKLIKAFENYLFTVNIIDYMSMMK